MMGVPRVTEKSFMETVRQYAVLHRWKVYHTHDSRRSEAGFPDMVFARNGVMVFAELKTEIGKVTPAQQDWIDEIAETDNEVFVWRPSDWKLIESVLGSRT